jgi:two-component system chemotaxis response regulator CheB
VNFVGLRAAQPVSAITRVMICDDSVVIRSAIAGILEQDETIKVMARPGNGEAALEQLRRQPIDVIVLDIEMPVMDGLTAVPLLLKQDPGVRIIMASTLTSRGADIALQALRLGAVDYLPKPSAKEILNGGFRAELIAKIKGHARLRARAVLSPLALSTPPPKPAQPLRPAGIERAQLLAIGSSTGGPQALFQLIQGLGTNIPVPVIITQHMLPSFIPILAEHLTRLGGMPCCEAQDGERLACGRIYVAPGDRHLLVERRESQIFAKLSADPPENYCRPAIDPMLRTASAAVGGRLLIAMLTGMGHDGLAGTRSGVAAGGTAIAQDEASSVVWGMPGAIAQAGLCHAILPLQHIAEKILALLDVKSG